MMHPLSRYSLRLVLTLLLAAFSQFVWAECGADGFAIWPTAGTIPPNSVFVVEGYMNAEPVVAGLGGTYPVYLQSGRERVPLAVVKVYKGQFYLTQAVVKPLQPLLPGRTYTLHIDKLDAYQEADVAGQKPAWTVAGPADHQKPAWRARPSYHSESLVPYGCGPAQYVHFCACIAGQAPLMMRARVRNTRTGGVAEYLVAPDSTGVSIGHGMCSGAFRFEPEAAYEASFALMDGSGNFTEGYSPPISFRALLTEADVLRGKPPARQPCDCTKATVPKPTAPKTSKPSLGKRSRGAASWLASCLGSLVLAGVLLHFTVRGRPAKKLR